MDKSKGWVSIWRCLQDNPLWKKEKFTRGQAWVDLIMLANHERGWFLVRGNKVVVERGQLGWSQLALSVRWKWSRKAVQTFLNLLETEHQIAQQKTKLTTLITLINYEEYQQKEQQREQQESNRSATEAQQKNINNNDNNENNDNKEQNIIADEPSLDVCPHQEIIKIYHEELPQLRKVKIWNDARMAFLRARWREDAERQNIEWWRNFFQEISKSNFLTGKAENKNGGKPFSADLEWIVRPANFVKILEGKYVNGGTREKQNNQPRTMTVSESLIVQREKIAEAMYNDPDDPFNSPARRAALRASAVPRNEDDGKPASYVGRGLVRGSEG